jgi:hypothetical protein
MSSNNSKYGQSSLYSTISGNKNPIRLDDTFNLGKLQAVRVMSIVLDEFHPRFLELGEWNGLGTIEYESVKNPFSGNDRPTAKPLLGNNKGLPLVNEIVYIIPFPDTKIGIITSNVSNYYINVIALWNHPHHNGYPKDPNQLPESQQVDYIQTQLGNVRRVTDQSTEIFLGNTFVERANIHPLLPFEGDIITEGRWGNSIRLGSTVTTKTSEPKGLNNWSTTGLSGDPIIIIRNGQGDQLGDEGWIPVTENINDNDSSIYLTSTQRLPLQVSKNVTYKSYNTQPQALNEFTGKQVIINSGRLVFNSNSDHILLTSNQSVGLNAINSVNIDTPLTVVQSDNILLGSKDATESMIKGDLLITELQSLLTQLTLLTTSLQTVPQAASAATLVLSELPKISANLEKTKSQVNKLI